jgi:D-glycero-D-manno-heptose 1,7-bisphosphate phosphatase
VAERSERTLQPSPLVLLDRDGTLNVDRDYLSDPAQLELIPGAAAGLRRLADLGCRLVVVTNQSGVARGKFTAADVDRVHARLGELLAAAGVVLDGIYVCPHRPEDDCDCRKPRPGLVRQALAQLPSAPPALFMVGDKRTDVELGRAVGATTLLVRTGYGAESAADPGLRPDYIVDDLGQAAETIAARLQGTL